MDRLLDALGAGAAVSGRETLAGPELREAVRRRAETLRDARVGSVVLYADNGVDWILADLACRAAGVIVTPLPLFFSQEQVRHALDVCGADALISDRPPKAVQRAGLGPVRFECGLGGEARLYRLPTPTGGAVQLPPGTQKITFTSGTTGTPKGVCLSPDHQLTVAAAVASAVELRVPRHLCVLPLGTLLENLAGVYAPLLTGGTVVAPTLAELGLRGSSQLDIERLLACIERHRPGSLILVPELLGALVLAAECGWRAPASLEFAAVGGGKVAPDLLQRARTAGLPVYEGYGLSECASVVSLNTPSADRAGSVGRPLPHVAVRVDDGELIVGGSAFLGYAGQPESWGHAQVPTGDIGRLDPDGFLYVDGRLKNQLITNYGRNLAPEWVESELTATGLLDQAVVFGDARPWCVALLHASHDATTTHEIDRWVDTVNRRLPDYARIHRWHRLPQRIGSGDGTATVNGRPRRTAIAERFGATIEAMYASQPEVLSQ